MSYGNAIMSSGWDTLLFLSHPDEIANFDFPQHAVALQRFRTINYDVFPPNIVKYRSRTIGGYNDRVALTFDKDLDSAAAQVFVTFQRDWKSLKPNLASSILHEILR